ncbi:uncharacterized protein LOC133190942 isoform X2 [Saccostrea echinata]|uniref:uncharacterized protein LOC133190942 isoform X2 n=1 Tax=Saccostrea echinata TaxID=191078 RepID=UPI002A7FD2D7|nr:uncharacterized protein LOC133190942 isoform X2 [Saccostrea echinata]
MGERVEEDSKELPELNGIILFSTDNPEENLLMTDAAQEVLKDGFLPIVTKQAIDRITDKPGFVGLKAFDIKTEIWSCVKEGLISTSKLYQPNRICALLALLQKDTTQVKEKNEELRRKMMCKCCIINMINCLITVCL